MSSIGGRSGSFVVPGGLVELASTSVADEVAITAVLASGTANVVPEISVVCDGSPVLVEFYSPMAYPDPSNAASWFSLGLVYDGARTGSGNGHWGYQQNDGTGYDLNPLHLSMRMTPTAGVHTFGVNGYVNVGSAKIGGQTAQRGMDAIQFRVSKIIEQGTVLKPFWTPPIVTQLPSNATVGDQVLYAADATNGIYWTLYYDGNGTYPWKFVGGLPMESYVSGSQSTTSSSPVAIGGPTMTIPLTGMYDLGVEGDILCSTGIAIAYQRLDVNGTAVFDLWHGTDVNGYKTRASANQIRYPSALTAGDTLAHLSASPTGADVGFYERRIRMMPRMVAA